MANETNDFLYLENLITPEEESELQRPLTGVRAGRLRTERDHQLVLILIMARAHYSA